MEKPIVLTWRETLAPDVIKAHVLETGVAPAEQERQVRVELAELTAETRKILAECRSYSDAIEVQPSRGGRRVDLVTTYGKGSLALPTREVREWPTPEREREDALHYARETIAQARKAAEESERMIAAEREEEAARTAKRAAEKAAREAETAECRRAYERALRAFVTQHGSTDDLARLEAGVYPESEGEMVAKALALADFLTGPLAEVPSYERITAADLDHDEGCLSGPTDEDEETVGSGGEDRLRVSQDDYERGSLPTMSAELWAAYTGITKRLPTSATWTLRRHAARCADCDAKLTRWSLLVRIPTALPGVVGSIRLALV